LIWIIAFPLYLVSRSKLKVAASAGASTPSDGMGQVAQALGREGAELATVESDAGMSPLRQKLNTAVGIFFGGWAVLALSWNLIGTEPDATPETNGAQPPVVAGQTPPALVTDTFDASSPDDFEECRSTWTGRVDSLARASAIPRAIARREPPGRAPSLKSPPEGDN
jgi:hypothetical protein